MPNRKLLWTLVSGFVALGCGGRVDTGVDPNKQASDLTPQEYEQVCTTISDALADATAPERQHEIGCRISGFVAGALASLIAESTIRAACQEKYEECLAQDPAPNLVASTLPCNETSTTCDVTVGEIETCGNDALAWADQIRARYPKCEELSAASFNGGNNDADDAPPFPATCNIFGGC